MSVRVQAGSFVVMVLASVSAYGCSNSAGDHHGADAGAEDGGDEKAVATNATCPTTQTLTYQNFGKPFFEKYCTTCHSSKVQGTARNGAPADHNFDSVDEIRAMREHIDGAAAAGPAATNRGMPRSSVVPTDDERKKLGEWLACNAP